MHGYIAGMLALVGNLLLSLGMVLQKKNVGWFAHRGNKKEGRYRRAKYGWLLGFTFMNLQPVFNYFALFGLPPNIVAAMIGTNVAFTSILATILLGERLGLKRILAVVVIFGAVAVMSYTGEELARGIAGMSERLYYAFGIIPFATGVVLALGRRRLCRLRGFPTLIAAVAGALGGYMIVTMKALQLHSQGGLLSWLGKPYVYIYFIAGAMNFSIIQLAFHHGEVSTVSPADYGMQVLWSAVTSYLVFGLRPDLLHLACITLIVASIVVIASTGAKLPLPEAEMRRPCGEHAAGEAER